MHSIPNVDLAAYRCLPEQSEQRSATLAELAYACKDHGFFLLSGHGQDALIDAMFAQSKWFFDQPKSAKMALYRDEKNPMGYFDRELTKQRRDLKEVFDFKAGGHLSSHPDRQMCWPSAKPEFQTVLSRFFGQFTMLAQETITLILTALGLPEIQVDQHVAEAFGERHTSAARLNYYPSQDPVPVAQRSGVSALGNMALHHHTDPGALTLLIQDDHGGLQARSRLHGWLDVPPEPGTIVVNIGDVLQVWSNDQCTAGVHRVLPVNSQHGRYSTPFFFQPRYDALIEPWVESDQPAHYQPFSWRDYIRGRVTDNFADYGVKDVQIDRYRLTAAPPVIST